LEVVVTDFLGQLRHQWEHTYDYPNPTVVMPKIQEALALMQVQLGEAWSRCVGIGLSAPLAMHQWGDVMGAQASHEMKAWEHIDLLADVQAMTPLPVEFAKDTTAACVAELVQGTGREVPRFLYVFVGTFVGGGLVLDGLIVNGPRGNAGAIGSMPMGMAPHAQASQLLEIASGWQLEQSLMQHKLDPLLVQDDAIMNHSYQSLTQAWLAQASSALAMCIASSAALLDLEAVVVDGSISPLLLQALREHTLTAMQQYRFDGMVAPALLAGKVGRHARALGGSLLPLHAQFFPDKDIFLKQDED
jgi:predicted NBD/HSP70 family sugar kinase